MGFAVGMEEEKRQERAVRGRYQKAAVGCWFTASGKAIPQMVKYEDESGCIQMLRDIRVLKTEQKYYAGILMRKYDCCVIVEDRQQSFVLLYRPDEGIWDMVLPDE